MSDTMPHEFGNAPRIASLAGAPCLHCGRDADTIFDDGECPVRLRAALDRPSTDPVLHPLAVAVLDAVEAADREAAVEAVAVVVQWPLPDSMRRQRVQALAAATISWRDAGFPRRTE